MRTDSEGWDSVKERRAGQCKCKEGRDNVKDGRTECIYIKRMGQCECKEGRDSVKNRMTA